MTDRFGPYELHELVGSGGMATVHRATIELAGGVHREVALKRLLPHLAEDERFLEDFVREAKLAVHLRHPNIIQIYELGRIGSDYFIAMELVRGISLMTLMKAASGAGRLLPLGAVLSLMLELTDALDHAYNGTSSRGEKLQLVHRDLTPSNLLVTDDGHLKIIDFGIAKAMRGDLATDSGRAKGKLGYMALEALKADAVDARADIFSTGVVMWELLTNHRLFKAPDDWDLIGAMREIEVARPSHFNGDVPPALDDIVLHAVAKQREDRWDSAEAMHRALASVARRFTATPAEVIRAKQVLRPETSGDPYVGFELEIEVQVDDDDEPAPSPRRRHEWTGGQWAADPTEPRARRLGEGSNAWPIEPATEEKIRPMFEDRTTGEGNAWSSEPSISIRELPVTFQELTDRSDSAKTDQLPVVDRKTRAKTVPGSKLGAVKAGARRARPFDPEPTREDRAFSDDIDTVSARRFEEDTVEGEDTVDSKRFELPTPRPDDFDE